MLTIKAPVQLVCNTALTPSWETFYHRVTGNYEMISAGITKEELLHVVTAPPEIYLGEGNMTGIVQNTQVQNHQETKLEIINNLLNRIVVMEDVDLTYQDRVYITNVLKKLGIQNVQQFMNEVNRLKEETRNTEQMISFYWNHLDELTQLSEEYHTKESQSSHLTENQQQVQLNLHENIMKRLQTGAVYQILDNFYSSYNGSSYYVSEQELHITEQKRTAAKLLLNQLRNVASGGEIPFVYRHDNYYETMNLAEEEVNEENVSSRITSAVLLNLVDNLFLNRFEKQVSHPQTWIRAENALYQTAENTLWRLQNQVSSGGFWQSNTDIVQNEFHQESVFGDDELPPMVHSEAEPDLMEQLNLINQQNIENYQQYQQMQKDYRQEKPKRKTPAAAQMREESLMALHNPQQLLEIYKEEAKELKEQRDLQIQELMRLLPEQTRRIYEELDKYREQPKQQKAGDITTNNIGRLLHDIQQIENYEQILTQVDLEQTEQYREVSKEVLERWQRNRLQESEIPEKSKEYREDVTLSHKTAEITGEKEENPSVPPVQLTQRDREYLLHDIRQAELESLQTRQLSEEHTKQVREVSNEILERWRNPASGTMEYDRQDESEQPVQLTQRDREHLIHDIRETESENVQMRQLSEEYTERIREVSGEVLERWRDRGIRPKETGRQAKTQYSDISFVHKSQENRLDEEVLEQLLEQNRVLKTSTKVTERIEEEKQVINTKVYQQTHQTLIQENQNLTEMIQRGVQRQLGSISDQVYSRLEKRLQNEKKRRGY